MRNREDYAYWISLLKNNPGYIMGVPDALVGYVNMPGSLTSNVWRNVVDTFRMYVSEVKMSPLRAAGAVAVLSCLKVKKEVWARISWALLPKETRSRLQIEVQECWNHGR